MAEDRCPRGDPLVLLIVVPDVGRAGPGRTYGHLARGADEYERELLDAFDAGRSGGNGRYVGAANEEEETS